MASHALDDNPRRVKQFVNIFRLRAFISLETGLLDTDEKGNVNLTLQQLGKFIAISMRWPDFISDLEKYPLLLQRIELKKMELDGGNDLGRMDEYKMIPSDVVDRWVKEKKLLELLVVGYKGTSADEDMRYSLWDLKVEMLLRTSPQVREMRSLGDKEIEESTQEYVEPGYVEPGYVEPGYFEQSADSRKVAGETVKQDVKITDDVFIEVKDAQNALEGSIKPVEEVAAMPNENTQIAREEKAAKRRMDAMIDDEIRLADAREEREEAGREARKILQEDYIKRTEAEKAGREAARQVAQAAQEEFRKNTQDRMALEERIKGHRKGEDQIASSILRAQLRKRGTEDRLYLINSGRIEARNIRVFMDGKPLAEHQCSIKNDPMPTLIGAGSEISCLLAITFGKAPPFEIKIIWDDDSGIGRTYKTILTF